MIGRCWGLSVWADGMRVRKRKGETERITWGHVGGAGEEDRLWSGLRPIRNESLIS